MIDIHKFYNQEDTRVFCQRPFAYQESTIACDGKMLLVSPFNEDYPELDKGSERHIDYVVGLIERGFESLKFAEMPSLDFSKDTCKTCKGTGKSSKQYCLECKGSGYVDLENDFSRYEDILCMTCDGDGLFAAPCKEDIICQTCKGFKTAFSEKTVIDIQGGKFDATFLRVINGSDDLRVSFFEEHNMLLFKTDIYYGAIMGVIP